VKDNKNNLIDAKICDLGISKKIIQQHSKMNSMCGTELYMSPEMRDKYNGKHVKLGPKIDTYGFGLLLIYLAYGKEPMLKKKLPKQKVAKMQNPLNKLKRQIDSDLKDLINKCLTNDSAQRISIKQIVNHPFLKRVNIGLFSNKNNIDMNEIINPNNFLSQGFKDKSQKFWITIKDINTHKGVKNNLKLYYEREIDFLIKCRNIPHIVQLEDFGYLDLTESKVIKIMKYYEGGNLAELIKKRKKNFDGKLFQMNEIKIVARCLLEFLNQLHKKNYCHRSLNPKNILTIIDSNSNQIQEVIVCGLSTTKFTDVNNLNSFLYSDEDIIYSDINILERGYYSNESDFWSVGMILYYLIFGKPFVATWQEFFSFKKTRLFRYPSNVDPTLEQILKFCTKSISPNEYSSLSIEDFLNTPNIF